MLRLFKTILLTIAFFTACIFCSADSDSDSGGFSIDGIRFISGYSFSEGGGEWYDSEDCITIIDGKNFSKEYCVISNPFTYKNHSFFVRRIGDAAFEGNKSITFFDIGPEPNSSSFEFGSKAFFGCKSLAFAMTGDALVGDDVFCGCPNLTHIGLGDNRSFNNLLESAIWIDSKKLSTLIIPAKYSSYSYRTGDIPTKGGMWSFDETSIKTIVCFAKTPPVLRSNGISRAQFKKLKVIVPTESVDKYKTSPMWGDFVNLEGGAERYLLDQSRRMETDASMTFSDGNLNYEILSVPDKTCAVVAREKKYSGRIVVPDTVTYRGKILSVTEIRCCAFQDCSDLLSIVIGNNVRNIGSGAFSNCKNLQSVRFGRNVENIGSWAFSGCENLTTIDLPNSLKRIFSSAFRDCKNLQSVRFGRNVENIGSWAFSGCENLATIDLPNSLKKIFSFAFKDCKNLQLINFGDGVKYIASRAFDGCDILTSFNLGNNVEYFQGCVFPQTIRSISTDCRCVGSFLSSYKRLSQIEITNSYAVKELLKFCRIPTLIIAEDYSSDEIPTTGFNDNQTPVSLCKGYSALKTLVCKLATPIPIESEGISDSQYMNLEVIVPTKSLEAYKKAPVWKDFWNLKGGAENYDTGVPNRAEALKE